MTRPDDDPAQTRARRTQPLAVLCLSAFGLGLSPIMPGTVGSLGVAALLYFVATGPVAWIGICIVALVFGSWATLAFAGSVADEGEKHGDPGWVVSDEVAGQGLASLGAVAWLDDWRLALCAFVLFRIFDMTKIGPVGRAERLGGPLGVLADDLVAGAIAAVLTLALGLSGVLP